MHAYQTWETKPWRPVARLMFSALMIGIVVIAGGLWLKTASRK